MKYDSELADYVKSLNLTDDTLLLIGRANYDLHQGPLYIDWEGYPTASFDPSGIQFNFRAACDKISDTLSDVGDLWIDTECGCWQESEPAPFHEGDEFYDVNWSDWYHMERSEVLAYIVGKELVRYVS